MKCTAKRTNGEPCNAYAVKGLKVCRVHGGSSKRAKAAAARRLEEEKAQRRMTREATRLIGSTPLDPAQALLNLVHSTAAEVLYWQARVDVLQDTNEKQLTTGLTKVTEGKDRGGVTTLRQVETVAAIEYRMLVDAKNRLAQYAATALKAGVEERRVKIAEDLGGQLVSLVARILDRLDLAGWQRELADIVVPEEFAALDK